MMLLPVLLLVGCDGSASADSRAAELPAAIPSAPRPSEIPSSATMTPPSPKLPATCPPPIRIGARVLAVSWPSYVGRRVSFMCRAVRRIDFTRTLVVGDGAHFVVMGAPDVTPCLARTSTFAVIGSTVVPIAGETVLTELSLEVEGECSQ